MLALEPYHLVWLSAHPERSEEWLRERLCDGFNVHHVDGNHENNEPKNLVLIEFGDHMMLHNGGGRLLWRPPSQRQGGRKKKPTIEELEAKLQPLIEARERKERRERRRRQRDMARARYRQSVCA